MLSFNKTTDYALIALAFLAERSERVWSAREVAASADLPTALLMKILKTLNGRGILASARGKTGGYQLRADLDRMSVMDLIDALDGVEDDHDCDCGSGLEAPPLVALNFKLRRFLQGVTVADLVTPGRRIDVPLDAVNQREREKKAMKRAVYAVPVD